MNSNLSFVSDQFGGLVNDANPQTIIDGYALLGARATLNGPDDRWSVSLFGNNLLDKQYEAGNLYQFLEGPLGLATACSLAAPPSVGFTQIRAPTAWRLRSASKYRVGEGGTRRGKPRRVLPF